MLLRQNKPISHPLITPFDWKTVFKLKHNWHRGSSNIIYLPLPLINTDLAETLLTNHHIQTSRSQQLTDNSHSSNLTRTDSLEFSKPEHIDDLHTSDDEEEDEQQTNGHFKAPRMLVAAKNKYIARIQDNYILTVSNCDQSLLVQTDIRNYVDTKSVDILGLPSTIVVSNFGYLRILIGFTSGSFAVFSVKDLKSTTPTLETKHFAVMDHSKYGTIRNIVHRQNLIAVYTDSSHILLFSIADGDTRTISVLKSYIDPTCAVSFSIRSFNYKQLLFCVSIAYCSPGTSGTWIPYIQEILCTPDGSIVNTRMSTCSSNTNSYSRPHVHGTTSPSSISYNHPHLLVGFPDNTLSYYNVQSAECCLEIQPRTRLWGHTKSIKHVLVKPGGLAVSVSSGFPEIRLWELEDKEESTLVPIPHTAPSMPKHKRIKLSQNLENKSNNKETNQSQIEYEYPPEDQYTGSFLTFDDDLIIVEVLLQNNKQDKQLDTSLSQQTTHDLDPTNLEKRLLICDFR